MNFIQGSTISCTFWPAPNLVQQYSCFTMLTIFHDSLANFAVKTFFEIVIVHEFSIDLQLPLVNLCLLLLSQRNFVQNGQGSISKSNSKKVSGKNFIKNRTKEFSQGLVLPFQFPDFKIVLQVLFQLVDYKCLICAGFRNLTFIKRIMGRENLGFIMIKNLKVCDNANIQISSQKNKIIGV